MGKASKRKQIRSTSQKSDNGIYTPKNDSESEFNRFGESVVQKYKDLAIGFAKHYNKDLFFYQEGEGCAFLSVTDYKQTMSNTSFCIDPLLPTKHQIDTLDSPSSIMLIRDRYGNTNAWLVFP